uniref:Uncharacterized protein n=1 Tax=Anopheles christyi TaxID=43041 RepID=A0A182KHV6_9DIPT
MLLLLIARNRTHQTDGYASYQIDLFLGAYERTVTHHFLTNGESCAWAKIHLFLFFPFHLIAFRASLNGRLALQLITISIRATLRVRYQFSQLGRIRTLLKQLTMNVDKLGQIHPRTTILRTSGQQNIVVTNNFRTFLSQLVIDRAATFRFRTRGRRASVAALFHMSPLIVVLSDIVFPLPVRPTVGQIQRTVAIRSDLRFTIQAPDGTLHDQLECFVVAFIRVLGGSLARRRSIFIISTTPTSPATFQIGPHGNWCTAASAKRFQEASLRQYTALCLQMAQFPKHPQYVLIVRSALDGERSLPDRVQNLMRLNDLIDALVPAHPYEPGLGEYDARKLGRFGIEFR